MNKAYGILSLVALLCRCLMSLLISLAISAEESVGAKASKASWNLLLRAFCLVSVDDCWWVMLLYT